jgi:hypothetical protein
LFETGPVRASARWGMAKAMRMSIDSTKDLCLLHLRDARATPRRVVGEILQGSDPITWSDLAMILRLQAKNSQWIWEHLSKARRIDDEQLDLAQAAVRFLERRRELQAQEPPHIYDIVWDYYWLELSNDYLFRGQRDSRWRQVSSLLRSRPDGSAPDVQTLIDRVDETHAFLAVLAEREVELCGGPLDDDPRLAIAQHYGFSTPLLDYTRSFRVAAFFATYRAPSTPSALGVIYYFRHGREEFGGESVLENIGIGSFRLLPAARISLGAVQTIEPRLPDRDNRIGRQSGVFIDGFEPRDLQEITIDRLYFRQLPGEVFEDPAVHVTAAELLPDDSPLALLAAEIKNAHRRRCLHPRLGSARLPRDGVIGSDGSALFAQLREGSSFFDRLKATLDASDVDGYSAIFEEYFGHSRAMADSGSFLTERKQWIDPFAVALDRLAELGGMDAVELARHARELLGGVQGQHDEAMRYFRTGALAGNVRMRPALACAVYLAAWEHLRQVDGEAATKLAFEASSFLVPGLKDFLEKLGIPIV